MCTFTKEVQNIIDSATWSLQNDINNCPKSSQGVTSSMKEIMERMTRLTRSGKTQKILQKYNNTDNSLRKKEFLKEMVTEFKKRRTFISWVFGLNYSQPQVDIATQYSNSGIYETGPKLTLPKAAFRYFRYKYDGDNGLDGSWLNHEAFSLVKLLENSELNDNEKYALFTALPQSGKTFLAIHLVIIYLAIGITPIIVVPKSSDVTQLWGRILQEFSQFVDVMKTQGFSDDDLSIYDEILYHSISRPIDDMTKFKKAFSGERNRCIVVLKHHTHIERLLNSMYCDNRIVLFIDEAHKSGGYKNFHNDVDMLHNDSVKYDCAIAKLKIYAYLNGKIILQTATAANILISEHRLWSDCIFQKQHGPWYRGPTQIEYDLIGTKNAEEEIFKAFAKLSLQEPRNRIVHRDSGRRDKHPIYLYIHAIRPINKQNNILQAFHNDNPIIEQHIIDADWLVMTFQGEGLRVWHKTFMGHQLHVGDERSIDYGSGEHLLRGVEPYQMIDWCGANGGVEKFPRIAVLVYDMGEEGTTFGSHNFPHWHLTHSLVFGTNITSARIAQILNRLSGNHGDNHPLVAMVSRSNKEKSIKEFLAHDRWIKDLCNLRQNGNFQVSKYLIAQKHMKGHLPKKYIALTNSSNILKTQPNPNIKIEKKAMRNSHAAEICIVYDHEKFEADYKIMVSEKKTKLKDSQELPDIERERLIKRFGIWAKARTAIANFMQNLEPERLYTRNEITILGKSHGVRLTDITLKTGKANKHGSIIKKYEDNYFLFPELVEDFHKHFSN